MRIKKQPTRRPKATIALRYWDAPLYVRYWNNKGLAQGKVSWFAMKRGYGSADTYGPNIAEYKPMRTLRLLNLNTYAMRKAILRVSSNDPTLKFFLSGDDHYSGGTANRKIHEALRTHFKFIADGTYVADGESEVEYEGPSEIVLWSKMGRLPIQRVR